jgi:hypothetical protein
VVEGECLNFLEGLTVVYEIKLPTTHLFFFSFINLKKKKKHLRSDGHPKIR